MCRIPQTGRPTPLSRILNSNPTGKVSCEGPITKILSGDRGTFRSHSEAEEAVSRIREARDFALWGFMKELALKMVWMTFEPMDGGNYVDLSPEVGLSVVTCVTVCIYLPPDLPM